MADQKPGDNMAELVTQLIAKIQEVPKSSRQNVYALMLTIVLSIGAQALVGSWMVSGWTTAVNLHLTNVDGNIMALTESVKAVADAVRKQVDISGEQTTAIAVLKEQNKAQDDGLKDVKDSVNRLTEAIERLRSRSEAAPLVDQGRKS